LHPQELIEFYAINIYNYAFLLEALTPLVFLDKSQVFPRS